MTSPVAGKIVSIHGEPGDMAPVGGPIAVFEVDGGEEAAPSPPPKQEAKAPPPPAPEQKTNGATAPKPKIKAQAGATWSEDEVRAAMQGAPQARAVPAAAMPGAAAPKPKAEPAPSQAVAKPAAPQ